VVLSTNGANDQHSTYSVMVNGATFTLVQTCPGTGTSTWSYTDSGNNLMLYETDNSRLETFTKQ
jgi:hypothetical protein